MKTPPIKRGFLFYVNTTPSYKLNPIYKNKFLEKIFPFLTIYLIIKLMYMKKNICLLVKKITFGKVCLGWCTI